MLLSRFQFAIKTTQIEDGKVGFRERGTGLSDAVESVGGILLARCTCICFRMIEVRVGSKDAVASVGGILKAGGEGQVCLMQQKVLVGTGRVYLYLYLYLYLHLY